MLNFGRLIKDSVGLFVLSLLLAACASTSAARDDPGSVSAEPVQERTPAQTPTETSVMQPTTTATQPPQPTAAIPDLGPAPEITNQVWINAPGPLTLEGLRGKVVLVEFWTYG